MWGMGPYNEGSRIRQAVWSLTSSSQQKNVFLLLECQGWGKVKKDELVVWLKWSKVKWKVKYISPCALIKNHAAKAYWVSGCIVPRIFDLDTRWRWVVSFTPRLLYPQGMSPLYPLDTRLGGPQIRSRHGGEEKILIPCRGLEPQIIQSIVHLAIPAPSNLTRESLCF
jgi:hypothetical protein